MTIVRFIAAVLVGVLLCYWGFFLFVSSALSGHLILSGYLNGEFVPGYFGSLYVPPLSMIGLSYIALRRRKIGSVNAPN
jgi:hypothetical protein